MCSKMEVSCKVTAVIGKTTYKLEESAITKIYGT